MLSVIIPMYNCGKYITRTLESLSRQGIEMEVIVIDDGSKDDGYERVLEFKDENKNLNIILLRQDNLGVSVARNRGLEESSGEYIYFCDADDFIKPDTLCQVIRYMQDASVEVVRFGAKVFDEHIADEIFKRAIPCNRLHVVDIMLGQEYVGKYTSQMSGVTLWSHIFKKAFFEKYNLRLNEKLCLEEDYAFLFRVFVLNPKVLILEGDRPYIWVKRLSSSSNSVSDRAFASYPYLLREYADLFHSANTNVLPEFVQALQFRIFYAIMIYIMALVRKGDLKNLNKALSQLEDYKLYPLNKLTLLGGLSIMDNYKRKYRLLNSKLVLRLGCVYSYLKK